MDFKELIVYKKAFTLAMEIYEVSKSFPKAVIYMMIHPDKFGCKNEHE